MAILTAGMLITWMAALSLVLAPAAADARAPVEEAGALAQARKRPAARQATAATTTVEPVVECPNVLGQGVATGRAFCDVLIGNDPIAGVIVRIPPHRGVATLSFDLHNRHIYSAGLVESGRGYTRATATIGALGMDGSLLSRAVVQSEFRTAANLFDRVAAGAGVAGVKAVAPLGLEPVIVEIPESAAAVSLLGEKLVAVRADGTETVVGPGRPIAVISNVKLQYRPAPARRRR